MESLEKFNKNRTLIKEILTLKDHKKEVEVAGWVHKIRSLGKINFLLLRDITGIIQVTALKNETSNDVFKIMGAVSRESVVYVKGIVKNSKQAPGGKEIIPSKIEIIAKAKDLPIDVSDFSKTELPKRLDYRFLDLHRRKIQAIFKIQSEITSAFREYFKNKGFIEVQLPSIISSASEGGTELFPVKYFEKDVYLAQSPQLYKQMLACSMERVFTITPVWRAEKHNTVRHLNESRQMDIEMAFADEFVVMKELENVVKYIIKAILKNNKQELETLDIKDLKIPNVNHLTFEQVKKLMKKHNVKIEKDDLTGEAEKKLDELFPDSIVFVHDWPMSGKPFYIMPKNADENAALSAGFDAIYRGLEITSGGQRIHIPELLEKMIKKKGLNPKNFEKYIDSFRYGAPPHAGWSIGLERLTQLIIKEKNIREAVLFPRDRDRVAP